MAEAVAPCPVEEAIQVVGGKWKLLVLRSLLLNGPLRYNELLGTVTAISQKPKAAKGAAANLKGNHDPPAP